MDEAALQACCSEVAQWLTSAAEGHPVPINTEGTVETFFFGNFLEDISSFRRATDATVLDFW